MIWKVLKNRSNEILSNEIRIRRELPVFCSIKMCPCTTYLYIMTLATVLQHDRDYSEEYPQSNILCFSSTSLQSNMYATYRKLFLPGNHSSCAKGQLISKGLVGIIILLKNGQNNSTYITITP